MGQNGGKRSGSGRKKGGVNQLRAEAARAVVWEGRTPAEFFQEIMEDVNQPMQLRLDAAKAATPLVHRKQPEAVDVAMTSPLLISFAVPRMAEVSDE